MSGTYVEPIPRTDSLHPAPSRLRARSRWPARIVVLLVALWVVGEGVSLAIQHTRLRNILTAQIAAAMGRPVEVRSYDFSFWGGPVIEAHSVTVGEDPRFGAEYFLRADSMAVRLRWQSLLLGRVEFGTLSLTRPSLNLVRNSEGDWNVAEWLPHPNLPPAALRYPGPVLPSMATRFRRIEFEGGRVNFKLADEKLPFAFVGVSGIVDADGPARWRINLEAAPWRAAVAVQQAGTLRVSGELGGTSSRLRPAALNINWTDASLSDVLRLIRRDDFGVRGAVALSLDARTDDNGDGWTTNARLELRQLHRWDLAQRPDNPSLNLIAQMAWSPAVSYVALTRAKLEAPHSTLDASGGINWSRAPFRMTHPVPLAQAISSTAQIDATDLLAWVRAFYPGVADNLSIRGLAQVSAVFSGWPPRLMNASVSSDGADLSGKALREPAHLGRLQLRYKNGLVSILPATFSWGPPSAPHGSFHFDATTRQFANAVSVWHISGATTQVRDLIAAAGAFGWNVSRGWDVTGPFACDLRWQSAFGAGFVASMLRPVGSIEFGTPEKPADGAALRAPFLNLPIEHINARVDLKPGLRQVKLSSADAFGARWTGTFDRRDSAAHWQFNLTADRLSSADLDRWLNPRWRESFLDRMLPFLNSRSAALAAPEDLRAGGHISIDRFTLAPLSASRLQGNLEIAGRRINLTDAVGQFYGGQLTGSLDANLRAVPAYHADLNFSRVGVAALAAAVPSLAGVSAASGSAQISFDARGASRADLIDSLTCEGSARLTNPQLRNVHTSGPAAASATESSMHFSSASADFSCGRRKIEFQNLTLQSPDRAMEGSGSVDFGDALDLRFKPTSAALGSPFRLTGTLSALQIEPIASLPPRPR